MTILVVFVSCPKLAEFLHVASTSVEKHHPVFFFADLLFVFEILRMQTTLSFPSGSLQTQTYFRLSLVPPKRSIVKRKQKKPFVSLKDEVTITQSFLTAASLAQVDNAPNKADSVEFVLS